MSFESELPRAGAGTLAMLGIDIGSTNTKTSLISLHDDGLVSELVVRSVPTPNGAGQLVGSVAALIRHVLSAARVAPVVIGIASMAETGVPLDRDGESLSGLIRWNGARDALDADALADELGAEALFVATGVQPGPKTPLAMWASLRRTQPELWRMMARWSGVAELIAMSLTGNLVTDHTLAGRTMAYRLPPHGEELPRGFDPELLAVVGLRVEQLPGVALPGEIAGTVTAEVATRTGLVAGTPVIVAGHDHAVGAWASGVREPAEVADSIGTTEALVRILAGPADRRVIAGSGMSLTRTVTGSHESLIAGSANAGAFIAWWLDELNATGPAQALAAVDARGSQPTGLLVLPYLAGRQTPKPNRAARLRVLDAAGHPLEIGSRAPAEITRALLEGLALQVRWMDAEQRRLAGEWEPSPAITVLGASGAVGDCWMRIKAAVMPERLCAVTVTEPVASGAALLAAVRLGLVAEHITLPRRAVEAGADHRAAYERMYTRFVAAATADDVSFPTPSGATTSSQGDI